uniref:Uncharacterized protein n=1 Tax=Cucumis melo TaxID=3656 RepID=A0A9I9ED09_CUCME
MASEKLVLIVNCCEFTEPMPDSPPTGHGNGGTVANGEKEDGINAELALLLLKMQLLILFQRGQKKKLFLLMNEWRLMDELAVLHAIYLLGSVGSRYLKNPKVLDKVGIKPPHGVLSKGPPGYGKTEGSILNISIEVPSMSRVLPESIGAVKSYLRQFIDV